MDYAGAMCNMVGTTKLPFGHSPLMLYNGEVSCQTLTGKISIMRLNSHIFTDDQVITEDEVNDRFFCVINTWENSVTWHILYAIYVPT